MKINKPLLIVFVLGVLMWAGVMLSRTVIAYDIFIPFDPDLNLKDSYSPGILFHSIYLYSSLAIYSAIGYILMILSGAIIGFRQKTFWKEKAWLFMAGVLFIIAIPFNIYKIFADFTLSMAIFNDGLRDFSSAIIQENFLTFYKKTGLQIWGTLSNLLTLTAIIILVFKPLNGFAKKEEE